MDQKDKKGQGKYIKYSLNMRNGLHIILKFFIAFFNPPRFRKRVLF